MMEQDVGRCRPSDGRSAAPSGLSPDGSQAEPAVSNAEAVLAALDRAWNIVFDIEEPWLEEAREVSLYDAAEEKRCMEIAAQLCRVSNGIARYRNGIRAALIVGQIASALEARRGETGTGSTGEAGDIATAESRDAQPFGDAQ